MCQATIRYIASKGKIEVKPCTPSHPVQAVTQPTSLTYQQIPRQLLFALKKSSIQPILDVKTDSVSLCVLRSRNKDQNNSACKKVHYGQASLLDLYVWQH